ncbi:MAG: 4-carboxy-4-hydroxy-2-oxoadipate aldolase/oxaloacetate decarboxylase [Acidimicrobiales bacterium]
MIGAPKNRHVVVRSIDRADLETAKKIGATGSATVHEAIGRRGYLGADILARQPGARIGGTAVTVLSHPGDNMMIHAAVEVCQPGDVLVVANTAPSSHGMFGDLLATSLMVRCVQGLVMDAGIRDLADLNEMGFPVWSRYVSCQGTVKATPGSVNVPVSIGGIVINPGDVISADDDGVVAVPRVEADWALEKSEARIANEAATRAKLEAGELGVDFYGLRDKILDLGVEYIDRL